MQIGAALMGRNLQPEIANQKFGISSILFAMNSEAELVGIITIRYDLTDFYKDSGHIGYSVPTHLCAAQLHQGRIRPCTLNLQIKSTHISDTGCAFVHQQNRRTCGR